LASKQWLVVQQKIVEEMRQLGAFAAAWIAGGYCNSLLYKGSEDDKELELEVTGWV
jgi:hypothetical protein